MELPALNVNYDRENRKESLKSDIETLWKELAEEKYEEAEKRIKEQKLVQMKADYFSLGGKLEDFTFEDKKENAA